MRLNGLDYSGYSNADLDQAYADAYAGFMANTGAAKLAYSQTMSDTGVEIESRLATPLGFLDSLMNNVVPAPVFPKFNAIQKELPQGFDPTQAATTSLADAASNVGTTITGAAKSVLSTGKWLGIGALAVVLLITVNKVRK